MFTTVAMLAIVTLCAISVGIEFRRGNKKAAIRNTVIAVVLLILCTLSLATKRPETSQPLDEAPQSHVDETSQVHIDDVSIHETLNGGEPKSDEKPRIAKDTPLSKPKDPTAGADVGKNIDPAPGTDTNNGIGTATSMH